MKRLILDGLLQELDNKFPDCTVCLSSMDTIKLTVAFPPNYPTAGFSLSDQTLVAELLIDNDLLVVHSPVSHSIRFELANPNLFNCLYDTLTLIHRIIDNRLAKYR